MRQRIACLIPKHYGEYQQKKETVHPGNRTKEADCNEDNGHKQHRDIAFAGVTLSCGKSGDQRGHPEHQQNVSGVRTHNVPESKTRRVVVNGLDRNEKFGRGGAKGDNCQGHDQRRHTEAK